MPDLTIRTASTPPFAGFLRPDSLAGVFRRHRGLIGQFAWRDVLERHKGAYLGVTWNILSPLVSLAIYTFVFGFVFESRWVEASHSAGHPALSLQAETVAGENRIAGFVLPFFLGHALFHFVAEAINRAPSSVGSRANLVKKVVFPVEILPVVGVVASMVYPLVCIACLLIVQVGLNGHVPATAALLPLCTVPLIPLCLGLAWMLASLGTYVRDIRYVIPVVMQLAMFLTPVFYSVDRIPEAWRSIYRLNPLCIVIENARAVMLWGQSPNWVELGVLLAVSLLVMQLGYAVFMRMRRGFADVV